MPHKTWAVAVDISKLAMLNDVWMKTCVYCGNKAGISRDHVPPRALFPPPRPANLITVPCCKTCNASFSMDDTYLRDMLCMREELGSNPAVRALLPTVVRSITGRERPGYLKYIQSRFSSHVAYTRSGLWIGRQPTLKLDLKRLNGSFARIVKGLHFHSAGISLDAAYEVRCFPLDYLQSLKPKHFQAFYNAVMVPLQGSHFVSIQDGVFKYRRSPSRDPNANAWQLTFYEQYAVYAATLLSSKLNELQYSDAVYPPIWYG